MLNLDEKWTLAFAPETGGSLTRCSYEGIPVLRNGTGIKDPRETSAFPMVPFIGRITNGVFSFGGSRYTLPPNMPPEPHAIHGHGWQSIWGLSTSGSTYAQLTHKHGGQTGWPWAYTASQVFTAHENTLTVALSLTNKSDTHMPAGLGWHPYFPKHGAQIQADVTHVWASETGQIIANAPCPLTPDTDLRKQRPVSELSLDHCFTAGNGGVTLVWPERNISIRMTAPNALRHLTVYTPPNEDYFCVEPVSHAPDALNIALPADVTGLRTLAPNETFTAKIKLTVSPL